MIIPESELILNSDGSVYHLNLLPEDISDTIIFVGDPDRVGEVSKYFDSVILKKQKREFVTHTGFVGKQKLTVISTGIGTDNIDIVMNELDALANIDLQTRLVKEKFSRLKIIRIGTAGTLQRDIPLDSFVSTSYAIGLDSLMFYYEVTYLDFMVQMLKDFYKHMDEYALIMRAYISGGSIALLEKFIDFTQLGITITCPGFYGPQGRQLRGRNSVDHFAQRLSSFHVGMNRILNFEMETAGIYGMANLLGHEAVSLSAIVANRIENKFSKDGNATVDKLIKSVLEKIETI